MGFLDAGAYGERVTARTKIIALKIEGYRSIRSLQLADLDDVVVLHGKNGSGKSNILRAVRLGLRAFQFLWDRALFDREARPARVGLSWSEALSQLDFRQEDLHRPSGSRCRIHLSIGLSADKAPLGVAFQPGEQLRLNLGVVLDPGAFGPSVVSEFADLKLIDALGNVEKLKDLGSRTLSPRWPGAEQVEVVGKVVESEARFVQTQVARLLSWSDAYRAPAREGVTGADDLEDQVHLQLTSASPETVDAQDRLEKLLGRARLFGSPDPVRIRPVTVTAPERRGRVHVRHPVAGDLPLTSLGTGQQQVFLMLARRILDNAPIAVIEEPEAHLHVELMRTLSSVLQTAVARGGGEQTLDQLWLATHHHLFAIAPEFVDVQFVDGQTLVVKKNRAAAAEHFYEPGPLWGALQSLLTSGLPPDTVIFKDGETQVTAAQVVASEAADRQLFNKWVVAVTEMAVLAMKAKVNPS